MIEADDPLSHSTHYEYDPANLLVLVTDELGNETSYTYDANRRVS